MKCARRLALRLFRLNHHPTYAVVIHSVALSIVSTLVYLFLNLTNEQILSYCEIASLGIAAMRLTGIQFLAMTIIYTGLAYIT